MRIIVCGGRNFTDYKLLKRKLDKLTSKLDKSKLVILSGHAKGADTLGEQWCFERKVTYEIYRPDYSQWGKKLAPIKRSEEMVKNANTLIAFWDGFSLGTRHIVEYAKKQGMKYRLILF